MDNTTNITWDAVGWLKRFRESSENRKLGRTGPGELLGLRKEVFDNTVAAVKAGAYEPSYTWFKNAANPNPIVRLGSSPTIASDTRFYQAEIKGSWGNGGKTDVRVLEGDCLAVARLVAQTEPETAILNMANPLTPGGGVYSGRGAQEEYLFRCSDYFLSLYQYATSFDPAAYGVAPASERYPLDSDFGGVFSRGVTVFRGPEEEGYPLLDKPWRANFIAVAGPQGLSNAGGLDSPAGRNLANKVRTVLAIAAENGQRKLVLSALGCGAFNSGATIVATAFRSAIESAEFAGAFDRIVFAIKPDHNDPDGKNVREFAAAFS